MSDYSVFLIILGFHSFRGWYVCVVSNKRIIRQLGYSSKYYPKRYILPDRKMRRLFGLRKKEIPKWCYYQFFLSFVYIALFVIGALLFTLDGLVLIKIIFGITFISIMGIHVLYLMVCTFLYKV